MRAMPLNRTATVRPLICKTGLIEKALPLAELFLSLSKKAKPFPAKGCSLLQRTNRAPPAPNSHVYRPRCIFSDAHVVGENGLNLISQLRLRNSTRFFDALKSLPLAELFLVFPHV